MGSGSSRRSRPDRLNFRAFGASGCKPRKLDREAHGASGNVYRRPPLIQGFVQRKPEHVVVHVVTQGSINPRRPAYRSLGRHEMNSNPPKSLLVDETA